MEHTLKVPNEPDQWINNTIGPISLKAYEGQDIVIGFQFLNQQDNRDGVWEIESLRLQGLGEEIEMENYEVTP